MTLTRVTRYYSNYWSQNQWWRCTDVKDYKFYAVVFCTVTSSSSSSSIQFWSRIIPVNGGGGIYPSSNLSNSHSPSRSIHGVLFLQTNAQEKESVMSSQSNRAVAIVNGPEKYDTMKNFFFPRSEWAHREANYISLLMKSNQIEVSRWGHEILTKDHGYELCNCWLCMPVV